MARLGLFEKNLRAMLPLFIVFIVCNAAAANPTRPADPPVAPRIGASFAEYIDQASRRFGVPARWIRAVLDIESARDEHAKSPKGAMGLMQIMPATWADLRLRYDFGGDAYDPQANILAGAAYLRELHDRYGSPGFLAAYNAGPTRYEEYLAGRPLPMETRIYLQKLVPIMGDDIAGSRTVESLKSSGEALFVMRSEISQTGARLQSSRLTNLAPTTVFIDDISAIAPQVTGLFVQRSDARGSR